MTRELTVSGSADEDIDEYIGYLAARNPEVARRFLRDLREACTRLLSMPQIGHLWETKRSDLKGLRAWRVDDFPVSIFYFVRPTAIEVVRVLNHSQDIKTILEDL
ncbi:type II toxin-antitoxin system RelE/ParE family toxin [Candidatus Binatia bacterium]|nr:type II toxin-antitoxin system RelE/ParE family toxin [Candidatus Binatia bacterium]